MILQLTTPPTVRPVTVEEIQTHLRIDELDQVDEVPLIESYLDAAIDWCQEFTSRQLITASWTYTIDSFPSCRSIQLPRPPLQSVTKINYYDSDESLQSGTFTDFSAVTGPEPGVLLLDQGASWPSVADRLDAVRILYVAGYGDAATDVPAGFKHAIRLLVGHWHENREATRPGAGLAAVPFAVESLLYQLRHYPTGGILT